MHFLSSLKKFFRPVGLFFHRVAFGNPAKGMIAALIERWDSPVRQLIAVALFLLMFSLFGWSLTSVIIVIVSMYLHEVGHAVVLVYSAIKVKILYLFPMGAVAFPANDEENRRSDQLPWNTMAWLMHAGPVVNVFLMVAAALIIPRADGLLEQIAREVLFINSLLAVMNLVPVWHLDAGQLYTLIYSSLEEKHEKWLAVPFFAIPMLFVGIYLFATGGSEWWQVLGRVIDQFGLIAVLVATAVSIWQKQTSDKPEHSKSAQAMNHVQIITHVLVYWTMILTTLWLMTQAYAL